MKNLPVLMAAVTLAWGIKYNALRVKFGWSDALAGMEYLFEIPRTTSEAEKQGWKPTERPPGALPELKMYCPPGRGVCPLYGTTGFVAGLQIALPVDDFKSLAIEPQKKFVKWHATASEDEPSRDYWTLTQFYVSEESLNAVDGPQVENGTILQDGGVWVTGLDGSLIKIPTKEEDIKSETLYTQQNCVTSMGTLYYYDMTEQMKCKDLLPWFALVTKGELVGTGFMMFGKLETQKPRHWFEIPPSTKDILKIMVPNAPECFADWASLYGIVSLHIYYINDPWKIRCEEEDSIKPASPLEVRRLNSIRYASVITDEFRRLFSIIQLLG